MSLSAPIIAAHIRHTGRYASVSAGWAQVYVTPDGPKPAEEWEGWDHVRTFRLDEPERAAWLAAFRAAQGGTLAWVVQPVTLPGDDSATVAAWALVPMSDGSVLCVVVDPMAVAAGLQAVAHG